MNAAATLPNLNNAISCTRTVLVIPSRSLVFGEHSRIAWHDARQSTLFGASLHLDFPTMPIRKLRRNALCSLIPPPAPAIVGTDRKQHRPAGKEFENNCP
jgi:hypothetical protein